MRNFTQNALMLSAAAMPIAVGWQSASCTSAAFGIGVELRSRIELSGLAATVRNGSTHGEKSVLVGAGQAQILRRNTMQLSGYEFGTSVDVDAPRVDVATGVPPRSRPV